MVQAVLTPNKHVAPTVHALHGVFPEAEKDVPATHGTWHTVSVVSVQEVLTPAVHVALLPAGQLVQVVSPSSE